MIYNTGKRGEREKGTFGAFSFCWLLVNFPTLINLQV